MLKCIFSALIAVFIYDKRDEVKKEARHAADWLSRVFSTEAERRSR